MKKTIYKIWLFYFFVGFITSCDYLDVVLDNQMTQEEAFSKRETTERYLAHIYDYMIGCQMQVVLCLVVMRLYFLGIQVLVIWFLMMELGE